MQLMGGNWPHDGGTHSSTSAVAGKGKDLPPLHTVRLHTQGMRNTYWCHLNTIPPRKGGQWERKQSKGRTLSAKHSKNILELQWPLITLRQSSKAFEFQKVTGVGFQNLMWVSTSLSDGSSSPPSSPSLTVKCLRCHTRGDSVPIPVKLAGAREAAASSSGRFSRKLTPDLPALEGPGSSQGTPPNLSRAETLCLQCQITTQGTSSSKLQTRHFRQASPP